MLARVIAFVLPRWFDRNQAKDLDATLELRLRILGGRRTLPFVVRVRDGGCAVTPGVAPEAGARVTIGFANVIRVTTGLVGWPALLSRGDLELAGDPFLALRFPTLFRLQAVGSAPHGQARVESV